MHSRPWWRLAPIVLLAVLGLGLLAVGGPSGIMAAGHGDAIADARGEPGPRDTSSSSEDHRARVGEAGQTQRASARERPDAERAASPLDPDELARREARREAILAAHRARQAQAGTAPTQPPSEPSSAAPQGLTNFVEGADDVVAELNRSFLPLSDECIEDARERLGALGGDLEVELELIVDESLGAIIETVDFPPGSAGDPQLHECMRESLLSLELPSGSTSRGQSLVVSLRLDDE